MTTNLSDELADVKNIESHARLVYSPEDIERAIKKVAHEMNEKFADQAPLLLCVMNGAMVFMGKLITELTFPLQMDYVHVSRYRGELRGRDLHWLAEPSISVKDRTIIIVEDILDSGLTLAAIRDYCEQHYAKKVYFSVLIDKDRPRDVGGIAQAHFAGLQVPDKFLIGYGLDYKGYCRNLPGIYAVEL